MNDLIVFSVGFLVSMLVVFGIFSRVPMNMHHAKETAESNTRQVSES
ncbi:MAG: hypothetical protein H0V76_02580 [Blastocatellia bacterium]|nr:hypothetical protein [Blastocatellia bacterium]